MSAVSTCRDEDELLPVATGEPADEDLAAHLCECGTCRERVDRLRALLAAIRPDPGEGPGGGPTGPAPAGGESDPAAPGGWANLFSTAATRDLAEAEPRKPVAIGKYVVVDLLDWGPHAEIYRVLNPNLGKAMVLKLARQPVGENERALLVDEARVLAELEHINLLKVYDSGFHDGRPYLVMEYVRGSNLEDHVRDHPVTPQRAASLVARLAAVLELVHRKGIIHRDIKPRNILIDEAGEPRLIDFGLALLRNAWSDPFAAIWGGTVAYMAPEQARREHDRIGTAQRHLRPGCGAVLPPDRPAALRGRDPGRGLGSRPALRLRGRRPARGQGPAPARADLSEGPGRRAGAAAIPRPRIWLTPSSPCCGAPYGWHCGPGRLLVAAFAAGAWSLHPRTPAVVTSTGPGESPKGMRPLQRRHHARRVLCQSRRCGSTRWTPCSIAAIRRPR